MIRHDTGPNLGGNPPAFFAGLLLGSGAGNAPLAPSRNGTHLSGFLGAVNHRTVRVA
jgi:hypothetical protein